jgi:hypothetical protein
MKDERGRGRGVEDGHGRGRHVVESGRFRGDGDFRCSGSVTYGRYCTVNYNSQRRSEKLFTSSI